MDQKNQSKVIGRPDLPVFDPSHIVYGRNYTQIVTASSEKQYPLLPKLYDTEDDQKILGLWEQWLEQQNAPYCVTKAPSNNKKYPFVYTLWKLKEVEIGSVKYVRKYDER